MIRNSTLTGIQVSGSDKKIKCKLFADDTMVHLHESGNLNTLKNKALDPWYEVSGAVFNTAKTEVIPISTRQYRERLIESRKLNDLSEPIQPNIRIAKEGQLVRVLSTWIGNGVDQATPWTPTIEKIATSLKRWEANHPAMEGRRLILQIIIGGMTQYLVKVQGMPESAIKSLKKLIRNFMWSGKNRPTISMGHMSSTTEEGGKKVLDITMRNEAIQLMWVQAYLRMGNERPTWALIADEILGNDVPGEIKSLENNPNVRINQFLQSWHSRKHKRRNTNPPDEDTQSIPNDLRNMIKIAHKHGVRLEAIHPTEQVKNELPAIWNIQTKMTIKPDTLCDKFGKYIRDKHNARSLKDITDLAKNIPVSH